MQYFYDEIGVRYTLFATNSGKPLNWLFIPGGPGFDSLYLHSLINSLNLSGNIWLIDLPGNGSNNQKKDQFDEWLTIFLPLIKKFKNPIIVGHSFGGMLPLLFTELENILTGLVILNSAPCLWLDAAVKFALEHNLPDLSNEMRDFTINPNQQTFNVALNACIPYYFAPAYLELGRKFLSEIPATFGPAVWWQHKVVALNYNALWVPHTVKTLIIGAEFDAIVPFTLFENDQRFDRYNIQKAYIEKAGHLPWFERPEKIIGLIQNFERSM